MNAPWLKIVPKPFTSGLVMSLANPHNAKQNVTRINGIITPAGTTDLDPSTILLERGSLLIVSHDS